MMLRYLTAGESHGKGIIPILRRYAGRVKDRYGAYKSGA